MGGTGNGGEIKKITGRVRVFLYHYRCWWDHKCGGLSGIPKSRRGLRDVCHRCNVEPVSCERGKRKVKIKFMNQEEIVAKILLDIKAVQVRVNPPFTWNTGLLAPVYCDNRLPISYLKERNLIIEGLKEKIIQNNLQFDVIAGTATAGIPWASFLALELNKPMVYVRSQPKDY